VPLIELEHYLVLTDDLEATRDFYCLALGLREGPRPPLGFPGYWLYVGDTPSIHVAEWVSERAPGTGPLDHIAFNAVDCAAVQAALSAYGVEFAVNEAEGAVLTQLFLKDPNGLKVEINIRRPVAARAR
jgi:catechol 2,3-dioxygenase-like lactoylglutathione lyase family enzyme